MERWFRDGLAPLLSGVLVEATSCRPLHVLAGQPLQEALDLGALVVGGRDAHRMLDLVAEAGFEPAISWL